MFIFRKKQEDANQEIEEFTPKLSSIAPLAFALTMSDPSSFSNLRGLATNLYSSFYSVTFAPFKIGDYVKTQGVEGRVVGIDFKYVALRKEKSFVYVPTSSVFKNIIEVFKK